MKFVFSVKGQRSHLRRAFGGQAKVKGSSEGFALIELLIAVVLFGIITAFVIAAYGKISEQLFTTTLAYETALSFRQAQSYGVSVKQFGVGTGSYNSAYGLHFQNAINNRFVLYADANQNNKYESDIGGDTPTGCAPSVVGNECVSVYRVERGNTIEKFCGVLLLDTWPLGAKSEECNVNSVPANNPLIAYLDVYFLRPNPDAIIRSDLSGVSERYKGARIYLTSPNGVKRSVEVVNTGQISIK